MTGRDMAAMAVGLREAIERPYLTHRVGQVRELVRLALPRRTYHREQLDHIAETFGAVVDRQESVPGLEIVEEPERRELRHFSAELRPVTEAEVQ